MPLSQAELHQHGFWHISIHLLQHNGFKFNCSSKKTWTWTCSSWCSFALQFLVHQLLHVTNTERALLVSAFILLPFSPVVWGVWSCAPARRPPGQWHPVAAYAAIALLALLPPFCFTYTHKHTHTHIHMHTHTQLCAYALTNYEELQSDECYVKQQMMYKIQCMLNVIHFGHSLQAWC